MRTARQIKLDRAVLQALAAIPDGYLQTDETLRADAARIVIPRATTAELDEAIGHADSKRRIVGVPSEEGTKWKITDAGRAWLAEHP